MLILNFGATAKASTDYVQRELDLACDECEEILCTVEDEDGLQTLALTTAGHYTEKHDGEGNFEH